MISAIVSAYYAEEFLEKRLGNLLDQEPRPEITVVCQRDSMECRIAGFAGVSVVRTTNIPTVYSAWNLGIMDSAGKYLTTANSDDVFYAGALYKMSEVLDTHEGVDVVFSDTDRQNGRDGKVESWKRYSVLDLRSGIVPDIYERLKRACFIGSMPMWRKSLHQKFGYFDESLQVCGDWDFWLRLAKGGCKFYYIAHPLGVYMRRKDSITYRDRTLSLAERDLVKERYQ